MNAQSANLDDSQSRGNRHGRRRQLGRRRDPRNTDLGTHQAAAFVAESVFDYSPENAALLP